jgi:hypothetical protein
MSKSVFNRRHFGTRMPSPARPIGTPLDPFEHHEKKGRPMAVDGTYTVNFTVPGGQKEADLIFATDGETLTGSFDDAELQNGRTDGRNVTFSAQLVSPFRIKIKVAAVVDGDTITGKADAGIMKIPFAGARKGA